MPRARRCLPAALFLVGLGWAQDADAKAAYVGLKEALRQAEIVAIVEVEAVQPAAIEGSWSTFHQRVVAHPVDVLKGELPATFAIAADRDFICAPVPYDAPATYLVFLSHEGDALATVNHHMGRIRVLSDQLDWPYDERTEPVATAPVLKELRRLIAKQGPAPAGPEVPELVPIEPTPIDDAPAIMQSTSEPQPVLVASVPELPTSDATTPAAVEPAWSGWRIPVAMVGGALAVMLGFAVALRGRRRRR